MAVLTTIGKKGYHKGIGVASLTFTPLFDRAAMVRRIFVVSPSGNDNWDISIQGQFVMRVPVNTTGANQLLGFPSTAGNGYRNLFDFIRSFLDCDASIPVPQGQTVTVASVGGATGTIVYEFEEHSPMDVPVGMTNGQGAKHYITPVTLVPPAAVTHASGTQEDDFASQIASTWIPSLVGTVQIPAQYQIKVLAALLDAGGVNTFSGAANHQSTTDHLGVVYQGQRLYTRDSGDGIPNVGQASAAGSANTVFGTLFGLYPPLQLDREPEYAQELWPLVLMPGSQAHFFFGTQGDSTGGANYAGFLQTLICDIQFTGMVPQ